MLPKSVTLSRELERRYGLHVECLGMERRYGLYTECSTLIGAASETESAHFLNLLSVSNTSTAQRCKQKWCCHPLPSYDEVVLLDMQRR